MYWPGGVMGPLLLFLSAITVNLPNALKANESCRLMMGLGKARGKMSDTGRCPANLGFN